MKESTIMENVQLAHGKRIYEASISNRLVVFVGAGISKNSGVPTWKTLISELKKELPSSIQDETDDLKIAQLYKNIRGDKEYFDKIKSVLKHGIVRPNEIHKAIFDLNPCHIVTTNYDDLLEQEVRRQGLPYYVIKKDSDLPYTCYENMIIKMHGDFDTNNIVLTESDYYDYSINFPLISTFVKSLFASKVVLFVGFSFNDLNLKMIINSIKGLLGKDFQPTYLLADYETNHVYTEYLKEKGIQTVWLPKIEYNGSDFENIKEKEGREVGHQIVALSMYSTTTNDLIDELYNRILQFNEELPYFLTGLEHIFPAKSYRYWNLYSSGLQLKSSYFKDLAKRINKLSGKRELFNEKSEKIKFLLDSAFRNGLYRIDELTLFGKQGIQKRLLSIQKDAIDYIYEFDLKKSADRLREISTKSLSYSYHDLETPFAYWILGRYYDAYKIYEEYAEKYWDAKKYILFFICKYNAKVLCNAIHWEKISDKLVDSEILWEKSRSINLTEVLSKCSIDNGVKNILSDLINYHNYLDLLNDTVKLQNEILSNKRLTERGGCSCNSSIAAIEAKIVRCFSFSNVNYIISTNVGYANNAFRIGITGLLLGHNIPPKTMLNGHLSNSRLEEIKRKHLILMIFTLEEDVLDSIFKQYELNNITISDDALLYLKEVIDNILKNRDEIRSIMSQDIFLVRFKNILFLCSKLTNVTECLNTLFDIYIEYNLSRDDTIGNLLSLIIDKSLCTEEQCQHIFKLFDSYNINHSRIPRLLVALSKYMMKNDFKLNDCSICDKGLTDDYVKVDYFRVYYGITKEKTQKLLFDIVMGSYQDFDDDRFYWLCQIFLNTHSLILELNEEFISYCIRKIGNTSSEDTQLLCILLLKRILQESKSEYIPELIRSQLTECAPFLFMLSPTKYDYEKIVPIWLVYIDDDELKEILKDPVGRQKAKEFIESDNINVENFKKRFFKNI